jgi:DNA-binding response OmpR family regulator
MKTVLIVEDYESIKNLYTEAFLLAGYTVDTADSGDAGLKKTQEREFDIIILDMLMLELSGLDFLKAFVPAKHPNTLIVVVSNLNSPNIIEKVRAEGVTNYLIKSDHTPKELVDAVQALSA